MTNKENNTTQNTVPAGSGVQPNQSGSGGAASAKQMDDGQATAETVKSSAKNILDQAKDSAGQAYGMAADKAASKIKDQKTVLSTGISGVADSLRQVGQTLRETNEPNAVTDLTAKYSEAVAGQLEKVSDYFENQDLRAILRDTEVFARRQPAIFIGAAFAVGLLTARFLKSSGNSIPRSRLELTDGSANSDTRKSNTTNNQTALSAS